MLSLLLAAALGASPAPTATPPALANDPDVRCYTAIAIAFAGLQEAEQPKAEELVGLTAILWYYYGRMEAKYPGADFARAISELAEAPDYVTRQLPDDADRCGAEAERKGKDMQDLGERLQGMAPLADGRVG